MISKRIKVFLCILLAATMVTATTGCNKKKSSRSNKTTTNKIGFYDENKDYEFVEGYTNELENKIKEYFHTHGEDNLFIAFG